MRVSSVVLLFAVSLFAAGCTIVEDGQVGVRKSLGKISDEPLGSGVQLNVPYFASTEVWSTKIMEVEETADVPSSEGLIVQLDVSVLFRVPASKAPSIRKNIGAYFVQTILIPYIRNGIRTVASGYEVKAIYSEEGRTKITHELLSLLQSKLSVHGIEVVDVLLRDLRLPQKFKESIEAKLQAEQRALQKQFDLQQAQKDAEIEVARARGIAQAQGIIQEKLTERYLQYLWVTALKENKNAIYIATEANMPMFRNVKDSAAKVETENRVAQ